MTEPAMSWLKLASVGIMSAAPIEISDGLKFLRELGSCGVATASSGVTARTLVEASSTRGALSWMKPFRDTLVVAAMTPALMSAPRVVIEA